MRTIQTKISEIPGGKSNGRKIPGQKISIIWTYLFLGPVRLSPMPSLSIDLGDVSIRNELSARAT